VVASLVAIFAVLFIFYASSAFLRARKRELGIFSLVGMLPRQIWAIVCLENLLIGLTAILTGVGGGVLTGKLFFLLVGRVLTLSEAVPFHLSMTAVVLTVLIFAGVFLLVSLLGGFTLRRLSVAEVFRSATRPRTPPAFRWWLAAVGLTGLAAGYTLLLLPGDWTESEPRMWPGIGLMLIATYLLFHQGSVAALQALRSQQALYYRRTSLLAISQMLHKVRDNAKVLFMVSILTTLVLVPLTVVVMAYTQAEANALRYSPIGMVVQQGPGGQDHERALAALQEHGLGVERQALLPLRSALTSYKTAPTHTVFYRVGVVSVSSFNQWTALVDGQEPVTLTDGRGILLGTDATAGESYDLDLFLGPEAKAGAGRPADMRLPVLISDRAAPQLPIRFFSLLIVDDAILSAIDEGYESNEDAEIRGFKLTYWKAAGPVIAALRAEGLKVNGTGYTYQEMLLEGQTGMLVLGFVVVLFFLATGQMLYFKLFTDLSAERQQYQALFRVGLRVREVGRVISAQTLVLFFAPLAVALAHAWVILSMLARFDEMSIDASFVAVTVAYLLMFGGYYLAARRTYVKALLS
jgi:putative ABC transport system permease protein